MNLTVSSIVSPPAHLPISATDEALAAAVVEEIERLILQRAIVSQSRKVTIDGPLDILLELEPTTAITSLTRWTPTDAAVVVDAGDYDVVTRDPSGTILSPSPGYDWPAPERSIGSFALTYMAGWTVTPESALDAGDAVNEVPASVRLMISRAISFRAGSGVGDLSIGSLKIGLADSYKTDRIPAEIAAIGRGYFYRPGLFVGRP